MSLTDTAALNVQLTAYAQGLSNELRKAYILADRLCPVVRVPGAHGQYKKFDDKNSFTVYKTQRAMGGDPNRIQFSAQDQYYNCSPQALEIPIDKAERQAAGEDGQEFLDREKIQTLVNARALSTAHKRVSFVLDNLTPLADIGEWSNPDIDPIDHQFLSEPQRRSVTGTHRRCSA